MNAAISNECGPSYVPNPEYWAPIARIYGCVCDLFLLAYAPKMYFGDDSPRKSAMAVAALKQKFEPELKTFHATMLVTRAEEWCVEAQSAEEALELLVAGARAPLPPRRAPSV